MASKENQEKLFQIPIHVYPEPYVIVLAEGGHVYGGYLLEYTSGSTRMRNVRYLGSGAISQTLYQFATEGPRATDDCRFSCEVRTVVFKTVEQILYVSKEAEKIISEIPVYAEPKRSAEPYRNTGF